MNDDDTPAGPYRRAAHEMRQAMELVSDIENGDITTAEAIDRLAEMLDTAHHAGYQDGQKAPCPPALIAAPRTPGIVTSDNV